MNVSILQRFLLYAFTIASTLLILHHKAPYASADDCIYGKQVDGSFWFDVVQRFNNEPKLMNESHIEDFAFAFEVLDSWKGNEKTKACWNPLATSWDTDDGKSEKFNEKGVKSYTERFAGVRATAASLSRLNGKDNGENFYYPIRIMLTRQGFDEAGITKALNRWTTGSENNGGDYVPGLVRTWKNLYKTWSARTISARHSEKCIDIDGRSRDNGTRAQQWDCHKGNNQQWQLKPRGEYYLIISLNSGKCLEVDGWSSDNGAKVQQWDCHNGENQQWSIRRVGGYSQIVARHSGKCLDVDGWSRNNGAKVQQWDCSGGENQQWALR